MTHFKFESTHIEKEFPSPIEIQQIQRTHAEREALSTFDIERELTAFNHFGEFDKKIIIPAIQNFLSKIGNNKIEKIKLISEHIVNIIEKTLQDFQKNAAWITLRVTLPDDDFKTPRWHKDGIYYTTNEKTYKAITTLIGPTTLFGTANDTKLFEKKVRENTADDFSEEGMKLRTEIATLVSEYPRITNEEIAYFLVGDENAAIHSEPPIDQPRIFLSILPGTKSQIEEFKINSSK